MNPILHASTGGFGIEQQPISYNWGSLLIILMIVVLVPLIVFIAYMFYQTVLKSRNTSAEWKELNKIIHRSALTREEAYYLKQTLKKRKVKHPSEVVKEPKVFDRIVKMSSKKPSAHTEHIVMSIRQKVFGT